MRIKHLKVKNFRSLENCEIDFSKTYSAISGKNNAGKTNIIKAIRMVIPEMEVYPFEQEDGLSFKNHFPTWKKKEPADVSVSLVVIVDKDEDAALFEFVRKFSKLDLSGEVRALEVELTVTAKPGASKSISSVRIDNNQLEEFDATEILRKIRSVEAIIFHNSTDVGPAMYRYGRGYGGTLGQFASADRQTFEDVQDKIDGHVQKLAKRHQSEVAALLGKLEDKYVVGLTVPRMNLDWTPIEISLGSRTNSLSLNEWGSGTRNRTQIILTLLRAKKAAESADLSDRLKPIVIIEEPESFLHPSAQAEFGRVLQEMAEELGVQVIVTTHSPFMLSISHPADNILVDRKLSGKELRESIIIDTGGDEWMQPFALALGINNKEFEPWKAVLRSGSDSVLLVEGESDKEYLELLRSPEHGDRGLKFDGDIVSYNGKDALKNSSVLKLIIGRATKCVITFDLDCIQEIERCLSPLGLIKGKDFFAIGKNAAGLRDIEGLLPDSIRSNVYSENISLVAALNGTTEERRMAKGQLKAKLLSAFKTSTLDRGVAYAEFYKLAYSLNKAFGA